MLGAIDRLARYPVKGFTPELLEQVDLRPGEGFSFDRVYAIEDGPSGFNPDAPAHIPKTRFTVLAKIAAVAKVRTRLDDRTGTLHAEAPASPAISVQLDEESGRTRLAAWLSDVLASHIRGPLRVLPAPRLHRFFDHPRGLISLVNLASVQDIESRIGRAVDPLRFRANIYVSGWPAWCELDVEGSRVRLGDLTAKVFAPITRCAATHVDPNSGLSDIDMVATLRREYGHALCGLYIHVERPGRLKLGDLASLSRA